jgi:FtsH-binding integral membrane protein
LGRIFENPAAVMILLLVLVAAIVVFVATRRSETEPGPHPKAMQYPHGVGGNSLVGGTVQTAPFQQEEIYNDYLQRKGRGHRSTAWILAVIGLFVFGIVLGPIAMVMAGKAESYGVRAPGGKILGLIDTIFGVLVLFAMFANN